MHWWTCLLFGWLALGAWAEDERPVVEDRQAGREAVSEREVRRIWLAGDSTVRNQGKMRGWGQELGALLDPEKVEVVNRAIGGRSARTFFREGRWKSLLDEMNEGDWVVIQFGHNDAGPLGERGKFRGSLKGTGDEVEEVKHPDGTLEVVRSYGWYLGEFARTAKAKGVKVALCSPVPHWGFDREGNYVEDWKEWKEWVEQVAKREGAVYVDLAGKIGEKYRVLGPEGTRRLFVDARTHTNAEGARLNAEAVAAAMKREWREWMKTEP